MNKNTQTETAEERTARKVREADVITCGHTVTDAGNAPREWNVTDVSKAKFHDLEFQDNSDEWHHFVVAIAKSRIAFGGNCNVGFIESGYIEREDYESTDETLRELMADLETYYNDGPQYVSRIVCNERM